MSEKLNMTEYFKKWYSEDMKVLGKQKNNTIHGFVCRRWKMRLQEIIGIVREYFFWH